MKLVNGTSAIKTDMAEVIINNTTEMNGVRFANIPTTQLEFCGEYQRPLNKAHANTLAKDFNQMYAGVIIVSYRNGKFYVIDGQHRVVAALIKGIKSLSCIVVTGLTLEQEAKMFRDLNVANKKPDPYAIFKANICNGDTSDPAVARDMEIKRICDKYNIEVKKFAKDSSGKKLRCLTTAREIVTISTYNGAECFEWIIDTLNATNWADDSDAYRKEIIIMLKTFWIDNKNMKEFEKKLMKILNTFSPKDFIAKAKGKYSDYAGAIPMSLYLRDLFQEEFNKGKVVSIATA